MTHQNDTVLYQLADLLTDHGFDGLRDAFTILLNEAMKIERAQHLQAEPYERTHERQGYANGYKPKTVKSRVGNLHLAVPQVRDGTFYPQSLEKGMRSERALKLTLAEMYVQGVSTRKLAKVTEALCGFSVSSSDVSRCAKELDEVFEPWRTRDLPPHRYVQLDARYEYVRHGEGVVSAAVLLATGIREKDGKRDVLGCSVALGEQEIHWRTFLKSLKERGLHDCALITSDAHEGLKAAVQTVFPSVPWQRCQTHLQRNAQSYVPKKSLKQPVASRIRAVFNAPDRDEADRLLEKFVDDYREQAPKLAEWAESNLPEGLTVMSLPEKHRKRLRTTNMVERLNKEIKRRTRVATMFPNEESCLRLVTAVVMETAEEWLTGKRYLNLADD